MARRRPVGLLGRFAPGAVDVAQDAREDEAGMESVSDTGWVHPIRAFDEWGITYVFGWNVEDAERAYAEQVGHEPLTGLEKQIALFNHVIDVGTRAMDGVIGG